MTGFSLHVAGTRISCKASEGVGWKSDFGVTTKHHKKNYRVSDETSPVTDTKP